MSEKRLHFISDFFRALSNPWRIRILNELRGGELTVSQLRERLNIELPSVSQQLSILKAKQILVSRKQGNNIYYACTDPTVFALLDEAGVIFNNHVGRLRDTIAD